MSRSGLHSNRGQSEVLGYILILGITFIGVSLVLAFGSQALGVFESQSQEQRAVNAFSQLDSEAASVALSTDSRERAAVEMGLNARQASSLSAREGGQFKIIAADSKKDKLKNIKDKNKTVYANISLGKLEYSNGEGRIAYQGGGVWRIPQNSENASVVSAPEFHYRAPSPEGATATIPLITIQGSERQLGDSKVDVSKVSGSSLPDCDKDFNDVNQDCLDSQIPSLLEGKSLFVVVESDYYQGWGKYFEQQTDGQVRYDYANDTVEIKMVGPEILAEADFTSAVSSSASGESIALCQSQTINSYDSDTLADGTSPSSQTTNNATITFAGNINLGQSAEINGNVITDGDITADKTNAISGNVTCGDGTQCVSKNAVGGQIFKEQVTIRTSAVNGVIDNRLAGAQQSNNNENASGLGPDGEITGNKITINESGVYLISENPSGTDITVQEGAGDVEIVVNNDFGSPAGGGGAGAAACSGGGGGQGNSGQGNSGQGNSGQGNSGQGNSGQGNSGQGNSNAGGNNLVRDTSQSLGTPSAGSGTSTTITIKGDSQVRLYVDGKGSETEIGFTGSVKILNKDGERTYNSSRFIVYADAGSDIDIANNAKWVGVVYAPSAPGEVTRITVNQGGTVFYGAAVGTVKNIGQNAALYYDEALVGTPAFVSQPNQTSVLYLHVSKNAIRLD